MAGHARRTVACPEVWPAPALHVFLDARRLVVALPTVEKHIGKHHDQARSAAHEDVHRRVLAMLAHLNGSTGYQPMISRRYARARLAWASGSCLVGSCSASTDSQPW